LAADLELSNAVADMVPLKMTELLVAVVTVPFAVIVSVNNNSEPIIVVDVKGVVAEAVIEVTVAFI